MSRVMSLLRPLVTNSRFRCTPMIRTIPITATTATITTSLSRHSTIQKRFMSNGDNNNNNKPLYAPYTVFKTRGALTVKFVPPVVEDRGGYQVLKRTGSIQIEMANASGERVYDWAKKEVFQLNVAEIGDILSQQAALAPITSTVECKYTHDPGLGSPDAGHIRKTFTIRRGSAPNKTPGASPRGVYFVNLSIRTRDGETAQYNMQLSDGEFTIIAALMQNCIPHLFAWSHVVTPQYIFSDSPLSDNSNNNTSRSNNTASAEIWDK